MICFQTLYVIFEWLYLKDEQFLLISLADKKKENSPNLPGGSAVKVWSVWALILITI